MRVCLEQVELLCQQAFVGMIGIVVNAAIVYAVLWGAVPRSALTGWIAAVYLVVALRYVLVQRFRRTKPGESEAALWKSRFVAVALLSGLAWGSLGVFLFPEQDVFRQVFIAFVLGGMCAAATTSNSAVLGAYVAYAAPALIPLALRFFYQGDPIHIAMGAMLVFYVVLLTSIAWRTHTTMATSIRLRFENAENERMALMLNEQLMMKIAEREEMENQLVRERDIFIRGPVVTFKLRNAEGWPVEYVSPNVEQFGYLPEELLGGRFVFEDMVYPEDLKRVRAEVKNHSEEGTDAFKRVYRIVKADGEVRWIDDYTVVVRDQEGEITHHDGYIIDITDRKRALEKLEESEEWFRVITRSASDAIVAIDDTGDIIYWNEAAERIYGHTAGEATGRALHTLILPERMHKGYLLWLEQFKETGQPFHRGGTVVKTGVKKNGKEFPMEMSVSTVSIRDRYYAAGFVRDITERKKAEKALTESERRRTMAMEAGAVGVWDWDLATNEIYLDPHLKKMLGYEDNEIRNHLDDWGQYVSPEDTDKVSEAVRAHFDGETDHFEVAHRMLHKNGSVRWILARGTALRDAEGKPYRMVGTDKDITERKEADEELRDSEQRLRKLSEAAFEGMVISEKGKILECNDHFARIFGYTHDEIIGMTAMDLAAPESRALVVKNIAEGYEGIYEHKGVKKDGSIIPLEVHGVAAPYHGRTVRIAAIRDITERKQAEEALRESAANLQQAQRIAQLGSWDFDIVSNTLRWSDEIYRIFEIDPEAFEASLEVFMDTVHPDDRECVDNEYTNSVRNKTPYDITHRLLMKDGRVKYVHERCETFYDEKGEPLRSVGTAQDITERKQAEDELRLAANVFENAVEGVVITDTDGVIQSTNPSFTEITGYTAEEAIGKNPRILKSDRHDREFFEKMWASLRETGRWRGEIWNRRKNGEAYLQHMTITAIKDADGKTTQYASVFNDITELRRKEEEIKHQAYHDALTGLPNRSLFRDRLKEAIIRAHRNGRMLAVLFIDIDNFKQINDSLGHLAGDLLLQSVATRLIGLLREEDTVSRYSGDEFTILLDTVEREQGAVKVAEKIMRSLSEPYSYKRDNLVVSVSVGIAIYPSDGDNPDTLVKSADMAMYHVKEQGKNDYQLFDPAMDEKVTQRFELENKIRIGVERDEFMVYYQPKVSLATGAITGCEALVRWRQPDGRFISPFEFIPLAEETGLIVPIGERVLMQACERAKAWNDQGHDHLVVSVNLSARQLDKGNLLEVVDSILGVTGLTPERLCLEITESKMMKDINKALLTLGKLRKRGVKISMDDFGSGYSSLSNLRKFPLDELKIDRFFLESVPADPNDSAIARAIVDMAHHLNLRVVAEGVETEDQLRYLHSIGCDEIQGYLFSPPVPENQFEILLRERKTLTAGR